MLSPCRYVFSRHHLQWDHDLYFQCGRPCSCGSVPVLECQWWNRFFNKCLMMCTNGCGRSGGGIEVTTFHSAVLLKTVRSALEKSLFHIVHAVRRELLLRVCVQQTFGRVAEDSVGLRYYEIWANQELKPVVSYRGCLCTEEWIFFWLKTAYFCWPKLLCKVFQTMK